MKKYILFGLLFLIITLCSWHCRTILYGLEQGYGQIRIVCKARPVDKILQSDEYPDSIKERLLLVKEIRQFAIDSLGINNSKNYSSLYNQENKPILWVVTASPSYELSEYIWHFPVVGDMPYKGYFNKEKAKNESRRLHDKGYDTEVSVVEAWSTLGYFKDPILSNMLFRSEGNLARVIIHELTHATIYIKHNTDYNENLATFVGDYGAKKFLEYKYGKDSKQYNDYLGDISDVELFAEHVLRGAEKLDSLYAAFTDSTTESVKKNKKSKLIRNIIQQADTISFYDSSAYSLLPDTTFKPNNAFFVHYKMYRENQNVFEKEFREEFNSDFSDYLHYLKKKYNK